MISVHEADAKLAQALRKGPTKLVDLHEAKGRFLRQELTADRDYPPFDRVAMDGYALSFEHWQNGQNRFRIQELLTAGQRPSPLKNNSDCIEIMTGAKLPDGCDVIVRYEDTTRDGDVAVLHPDLKLMPFANVHRRADDCQFGDAFAAARMNPALAAVAASFGVSQVAVAAVPRVAILGTGDELVPIEKQPLDYQIRASNTHALRMAMEARGYQVTFCQTLADDRSLIYDSVQTVLQNADILLMTGAVSAGAADFVPSILADLGVQKYFHKIAQKPGKPLWFGMAENGCAVFGLPGNPVSSLICAYRYALPFAAGMQGDADVEGPYAELISPLPVNRKMTFFMPVTLRYSRDARLQVEAVKNMGSGDFVSLSKSAGFIEIPGEMEAAFEAENRFFRLYQW